VCRRQDNTDVLAINTTTTTTTTTTTNNNNNTNNNNSNLNIAKRVQLLKLKPEVDFQLCGRHLEKSI